jgi:hypothetical protein
VESRQNGLRGKDFSPFSFFHDDEEEGGVIVKELFDPDRMPRHSTRQD